MHKGACYCGKVAWEIDGSKRMVCVACHCNSCRSRTGQMFYQAQIFPGGSLKFTKGEENIKEIMPQTEDGKGNIKRWASCCGTDILLQQHDRSLDKIGAGNLPTLEYKPAFHVFCNEGLACMKQLDSAAKYLDLPAGFGGSDKTCSSTLADSKFLKDIKTEEKKES